MAVGDWIFLTTKLLANPFVLLLDPNASCSPMASFRDKPSGVYTPLPPPVASGEGDGLAPSSTRDDDGAGRSVNLGVDVEGVRTILDAGAGANEARGEFASRREEGGGMADRGDGVDEVVALAIRVEGDLGEAWATARL